MEDRLSERIKACKDGENSGRIKHCSGVLFCRFSLGGVKHKCPYLDNLKYTKPYMGQITLLRANYPNASINREDYVYFHCMRDGRREGTEFHPEKSGFDIIRNYALRKKRLLINAEKKEKSKKKIKRNRKNKKRG